LLEGTVQASSPHAQLLERESTGLVLVDLQAKLLPAMLEPAATLRNCRILLRLAEVLQLPVILTAQYVRDWGPSCRRLSRPRRVWFRLREDSFGCFGEPEFSIISKSAPQGAHSVVAGVESHICVMQTALGALAARYLVHVASTPSARTRENWQMGLDRMQRAGA
jgi:nicotinamidase-related amidase